MAHRGMKFGIFLAPFHRVGENPTLAINRDVELLEWLDWLGYDEAWIGEHHSAGWELIALPELIILDDWGFPIVSSRDVPSRLLGDARATVRACPRLALRLDARAGGHDRSA